MKIMILDANETILASSRKSGYGVSLVYKEAYQEGDQVVLEVDEPGIYLIQLDETLGTHPLYLEKEASFSIPVSEVKRTCYSPYAFQGSRHLLTLSHVDSLPRRNLACNPYDHHETKGLFPHASANVETRGEMVFAARNAIDGIFANEYHGEYPWTSWGINQDPKAELHIDFGRPVIIDEVRLTLRADWPHDSWWSDATLIDSDGDITHLSLEKSSLPQRFPVQQKTITCLTLCNLKKADDPSPFPALTQIEVYGTEG
ncbi:carbohydrate-binding protein [uncultured Sphaerochaeta sp.]|uniref:carbohydrate-binding protein n=1 Tax=uncultured Sphaerochaeta sp. TaxID=886478 RepID=UPI0029CA8D7A|nr:carbohydrate-binding protein [uncultured Sphaerochaeta sp.]